MMGGKRAARQIHFPRRGTQDYQRAQSVTMISPAITLFAGFLPLPLCIDSSVKTESTPFRTRFNFHFLGGRLLRGSLNPVRRKSKKIQPEASKLCERRTLVMGNYGRGKLNLSQPIHFNLKGVLRGCACVCICRFSAVARSLAHSLTQELIKRVLAAAVTSHPLSRLLACLSSFRTFIPPPMWESHRAQIGSNS